ncbi:MAG: hypothetical protein JWQ09_1400 [Segetibacter sp.]|nr:hypothetical protein [Segetibacter sp.]
MTFKRIVTFSFDKWWRPIVLLFSTGLLCGISIWVDISLLQILAFILFCFSLFILGISLFYQLWRKRWTYAILTFLILGGSIGATIFYAIILFFVAMNEPDTFADNLTIPKNIVIYNPADMGFDEKKPDSISSIYKNNVDFQLYNSFQPGLYQYDFWTSKIDSGAIYLKAYEITHNYPLSSDRLPKSSRVAIYNETDSIIKVGTSNHFTIYEGDWDKPYAARFEVWFKPANGGQERKLLQKNYKIEGWMR